MNKKKDITSVKKQRKKPPEIHIVTTIQFGYMFLNKERSADGIFHSYRKRLSETQRKYFTLIESVTWGWYSDFKTAEKSVLENWGDIFEGNLSYAVIETVSEGITNLPKETWYKWRGPLQGKTGGYKPGAKKPKKYERTAKFWG